MSILFQILQVLGSLGLFLYGMTLLSESLQKVAGDKMRSILAAMTSNSFKRVLTGLFITAIIQSSSATTVMVVSFVNAGLLSLTQSIGVIMGANIGTTVTAWIISLLGFKADISVLSIPLIGVGFAFMMSKSKKRKSIGELIIGFALLFLGLSFLKNSVPDLKSTPEVLEFIKEWTSFGFFSVLIFVAFGTLLTIVLQSSSATMALTLVMSSYGWIPFEMAAAMVLGENIGTTITANIAAAVANVSSRRAALAHTVFNLFGVTWVLILFNPILRLVSYITISVGGGDPFLSSDSTLYGVSFLHTLFNLTNTLLLVWFTPQIVKLVSYVIKAPKVEEVFRLQFIQGGLLSTAELSLTQAKHEIVNFAHLGQRQFEYVRSAIKDCDKDSFDGIFSKLEHYEQITDRVELEIANYLNNISEGEISEESGRRLQAMYTIISEIESIGDSGYNIARILQRKKVYNSKFDPDMVKKLEHMLDLLDNAFKQMIFNLELGYKNLSNISGAEDAENSINEYRNHLKEEHLLNLENNVYNYQTGVFYMDVIAECEKVGDYIINVSEAIIEVQ
ncbi:MAG TPA: Na/Pi cotransporter [Rikenellaceae bacterium]|nr:MAG: Na/Pi cotransporter [Bacteroidetes bacterium GWE2_40_15]PKP07203.1 MAG: Na/Pi cotransporter [Bacteroidetes bacterium HGW-Bacteroidetes-5]HBZ26752.1 Na/Pi cotransporter [Rikenellaceae bacterium]